MADYANKYVDAAGVKYLWDKAEDIYMKKDGSKVLSDENFTSVEKAKLADLENYSLPNASAETLGGIKIGDGLAVDENGVVRTVNNPAMDVDWQNVTSLPSTLEGYGITDAATKAELEAVKTDVSKVYKYKGKVATVADLDNISNPLNGDTYDVEEDGTNYTWNEEEARWDNLGSIIKLESLSNMELDLITGCASSVEALKSLVADGGEVLISNNLALEDPLVISKDTVIDLSNHTMNVTNNGYALTAQGAKLTLKNGTINNSGRIGQAVNGGEIVIENGVFDSGDVAFVSIGENAKVTFKSGDITCVEGGIGAFDGGEVEISGGTITGTDNFPVFTNGSNGRGGNTIIMNGGKLVGNITSNGYEACGVYIANNDTFIMNGGEIVANNGCGLLMRAGNVTINGGTITANGTAGTSGWVGDNKTKMSKSAIIYHETANYPGKAGMSLTINGGTFKGVDHSLEILSNEEHPQVFVNQGNFEPNYPET